MDVRDLELVLAICGEGGFSGAARAMGVSQPTLSRNVARLEAELGLKLFERGTGSARPTLYGAFLAERATAIVHEIDGLTGAMHQLAKGERGRLRIAAGPVARVRPLRRLVAMIARDFPNLAIEMLFESGPGVMEAVESGRADIGIGNASRAQSHDSLMRQRLYEDTPTFVVRSGHPILALSQAGPRDLLSYPLALLSVAPHMVEWLAPASTREFDNLRAFVCDDYSLLEPHLERTDAIGFGPSFLFSQAIAEGRLAPVSTAYRRTYTCWLLGQKDMWRAPVVRAVVRLAREAARLD